MLLPILLVALGLALAACAMFNQPKFGKLPEGERLEAIKESPNYVDDAFQNTVPTPQLTEGKSMLSVSMGYLFSSKVRPAPKQALPTSKTDLKSLDGSRDCVVWMGHSSFFIQLGGRNILIDPVFSDHAAPFSFINKAFNGSNIYTAEEMPEIDYLLISHDHWDHLDYPTVTALLPKVKQVLCPLGVGAHLEHWGFAREKIHEADWHTEFAPEDGITFHILPARHFSGRLLTRNKSLWAGFALQSPAHSLFFSGDSGYGPHIAEIAKRFTGFDLVMLDSGQYDANWAYVHMTPEQAAQAAEELRAKALLPAHIGKFCIANHPWDEPFDRISEASRGKPYKLLTPMIGQTLWLDNAEQKFFRWWEGVE